MPVTVPNIPSHNAGGRVGLLPVVTTYLSDLRKAIASLPIGREEAGKAHAAIAAAAKGIAAVKASFDRKAREVSGPLDAVIAARSDEKMKAIAPTTTIAEERERIAMAERRSAYRALLQQLAGEKAEAVLKLATDAQAALAVFSDAIDRAAARERLPVGLLGGIEASAVLRIRELREHFAGCLPSEMRQSWRDVLAAGSPDDAKMAAHVLGPMARTVASQGPAAWKKKRANAPAGEADRQIAEARGLYAEIEEWKRSHETGDIAAARALHDGLAWCWRRLCGLDATRMRRGEFEKHAYSGDALGLTMRLAPVEDIIGRHVETNNPMRVESR